MQRWASRPLCCWCSCVSSRASGWVASLAAHRRCSAEFGSQTQTPGLLDVARQYGHSAGRHRCQRRHVHAEQEFQDGRLARCHAALAVIVIPALLARYKLADSPLFERLKQKDQLAKMPSFAVFKKYSRPIFLLALVSAFQQMDGYVSGTYIITFHHLAGIPLATTAIIMMSSRIGDIGGVGLSGPLADLLKRRKVAYLAIAATFLISYPLVHGDFGQEHCMVHHHRSC